VSSANRLIPIFVAGGGNQANFKPTENSAGDVHKNSLLTHNAPLPLFVFVFVCVGGVEGGGVGGGVVKGLWCASACHASPH
jgi:hypothetical protein